MGKPEPLNLILCLPSLVGLLLFSAPVLAVTVSYAVTPDPGLQAPETACPGLVYTPVAQVESQWLLSYAEVSLFGGGLADGSFKVCLKVEGGSTLYQLSPLFTKDTVSPSVAGLTANAPDGTYRSGAVLPLTLTYSEPVLLTGSGQTLLLETGATNRAAAVLGVSGPSLSLLYSVSSGDSSLDLDVRAGAAQVSLGAGTIKDQAGNPALLSVSYGLLSASRAIAVNGSSDALISWTQSPERAVNQAGGGYRIYYGTSAGFSLAGAPFVNAPYVSGGGAPVSVLVPNLEDGTYYFKIEAYSALTPPGGGAGAKSLPSSEITLTLP